MRRYYFVVFFLTGFVSNSFSQKSLNDYRYVVVPLQYNFLSEKDQFQLNSFTKFLFNKYGFNAYFNNEIPDNFKRCEGLWSNLEYTSGFIYTKISVILEDCNGEEVFRSVEGKSKLKEYKKAYHDAVRKSFNSISSLKVNQNANTTVIENEMVSEIPVKTGNKVKSEAVVVSSIVSNKEPTAIENTELYIVTTSNSEIKTTAKKQNTFSYSNDAYLLIPLEKGFSVMYKDINIGKIKPTSVKNIFLVATSKFNGVGYKTEQGFVIERKVEGETELVIMKFKIDIK